MRRLTILGLLLVAACGASTPSSLSGPPSATATAPVTATVGATAIASSGTGTASPISVRPPYPTPTPVPTPTVHGGVVSLTEADGGTTVRVHVGDRIQVRLANGTWDQPTSGSSGIVVRRSSSGGYPSTQPAEATFQATSAGATDLRAQSDASCLHTNPRCMIAQREWDVRIIVS